MAEGIIILGSARSDGNARSLADELAETTGWPLVDLNTKTISGFDYAFRNREDDFLPLMEMIVGHYDTLLLVTPVYWYSMSGTMKLFLDRFSDLLMLEKDLGRGLRGMRLEVAACGADAEVKEGFFMPFRETARYLGMTYGQESYRCTGG